MYFRLSYFVTPHYYFQAISMLISKLKHIELRILGARDNLIILSNLKSTLMRSLKLPL